jgi:hypothetical protein
MDNFKVYLSDLETKELYDYINDGSGDWMPEADSHYYSPDNLNNTTEGDSVEHKQYSIGDLLKYLQYDYYYNVLLDPSTGKKLKTHRRLVIKPVPKQHTYNISIKDQNEIIRTQYESNAENGYDDYEWKIMYDGEIFGSSMDLIYALRDACKKVHDRGLWKLDNPDVANLRTFFN